MESKKIKHQYFVLLYVLIFFSFKCVKDNENLKWKGEWKRCELHRQATLEITKVFKDSIFFNIIAFDGTHDGMIEGAACLKDNYIAVYNDNDNCQLIFKLYGDTLIIVDQDGCFGPDYSGVGVRFYGSYYNSSKIDISKRLNSFDLVKLGVFDNYKQDSIFRSLVKEDYLKFVNTSHLIYKNDSCNYIIISSGIRGMFCYLENIIIIEKLNNLIYAAVIDDEKIYYYTNSPEFKNLLPQPIKIWKSRFNNYPVIFK